MPDRSNAERRSMDVRAGRVPGPGDRLRHRRRPARGRARGGGQELRPRRRGIHQGASGQPRRRQRPAGARSRQAARVPGPRISCSYPRRRRALRRSARRVPARVGAEPQRCPRGRSAARRSSEAPHEDRGDAQRKNRARVADRALARPPAARARSAGRREASRLARLQLRKQPQCVPIDRAVCRAECRLRSGFSRRDHQRGPPEDDARRRADVGDGQHADLLPRQRAAYRSPSFPTRPPSAASTKNPSSRPCI